MRRLPCVLYLAKVAFGSRSGSRVPQQYVLHNFQGTWKGKQQAQVVAKPSKIVEEAIPKDASPNCNLMWENVKMYVKPAGCCLWLWSWVHLLRASLMDSCVPGNSKSPSGEDVSRAVDGLPSTKLLVFIDSSSIVTSATYDADWLVSASSLGHIERTIGCGQ